jgi:hypothetical protein
VEQPELLKYTIQALERFEISYAIVGSFASGVWGETRFTQDIDILVALAPANVEHLRVAFPPDDFYLSESAAQQAIAQGSQFNIIHPASGNKIDFMIVGREPWMKAQMERRKRVSFFPDLNGAVASPEDVIIGKLVYYRDGGSEKHLRDIAGILAISGELVDREYVARSAAQVGASDIWEAILNSLG